jgi:lipopolysaccharide export LptBFGC system permease protein LptF
LIAGFFWHIAKEKSGLSTKLVSRNGKVNRYDKGFNNRQNALLNITSSIRNGFIDDGIFIEAMIAAKTRQDVVDAINAYGYLKPKRVAAKKKKTELIAGVTVKNGKRVDAVKVVKKKSGKVKK